MIRTGDEYRNSLQDDREVWMNGERVSDVTTHPMFKPLVDVRARIYDMQHDPETRDAMTYQDEAQTSPAPSASSCPTPRTTGRSSASRSMR